MTKYVTRETVNTVHYVPEGKDTVVVATPGTKIRITAEEAERLDALRATKEVGDKNPAAPAQETTAVQAATGTAAPATAVDVNRLNKIDLAAHAKEAYGLELAQELTKDAMLKEIEKAKKAKDADPVG